MGQNETFLFLAPDLERFLLKNDLDAAAIVRKCNQQVDVSFGTNPASDVDGQKEPVTIILASAAVIAALTPILRELIRNLSGRDVVIRERRLVPVEDSKGAVVHDASGTPILHWVDVAKGQVTDATSQPVTIKGFGIDISFGESK